LIESDGTNLLMRGRRRGAEFSFLPQNYSKRPDFREKKQQSTQTRELVQDSSTDKRSTGFSREHPICRTITGFIPRREGVGRGKWVKDP
jgi:hypothetical protein